MDVGEFIKLVEYARMTSAGLSLPAVLGLVFLLWRAGFLKIGGNGNGNYQPQIDALAQHSEQVNGDLREIRDDMSEIRSDVAYIRGVISKT